MCQWCSLRRGPRAVLSYLHWESSSVLQILQCGMLPIVVFSFQSLLLDAGTSHSIPCVPVTSLQLQIAQACLLLFCCYHGLGNVWRRYVYFPPFGDWQVQITLSLIRDFLLQRNMAEASKLVREQYEVGHKHCFLSRPYSCNNRLIHSEAKALMA